MENLDQVQPENLLNNVTRKILSSRADLELKDHPLAEMLPWCEKQGDIVAMSSGLILVSDLASRSIPNCKIVMMHKGLRPRKVMLATQELISLLLGNMEEAKQGLVNEITSISAQQQRLRTLVTEAIREQASDIHIELREDVAHIRFRRHGELYLHAEWLPQMGREVAAVAFNKETDHAITHFNPMVPQNASMPMHIDGVEVRLRLASLPAHGGFDMVMRVLTSGNERAVTLQELGYAEEQIELINKVIQLPHGTILVSGPTGSGKTTTLASCIQMMRDERKIYTIEDPVEKLISNATQVPVNTEKEDRGFASMGRAALRMDPDVIVLGELRDEDTARVVIRAAITGHLVFSTVHTHNATGIITRLIDMGISATLLSDPGVLAALICQRLVPTLCEHCAVPVLSSREHKNHLARWQAAFDGEIAHLRARGKNCTYCKGMGIDGRTVVAEIVLVDEAGRFYIQKGDTLGWEKHLRSQGWHDYRYYAKKLVCKGICDPLDMEKTTGLIHKDYL